MSPWLVVALTAALLVGMLVYVALHIVPGRYRPPSREQLRGLPDGVYVFLNPG